MITIVACRPNDPQENENFVIYLNNYNNYFKSEEVGYISIHDLEGNLIEEVREAKNKNYTFQIPSDNSSVLLSVLKFRSNAQESCYLDTYLIKNGITISLAAYSGHNSERDKIIIDLEENEVSNAVSNIIEYRRFGGISSFYPKIFPYNLISHFELNGQSRKVLVLDNLQPNDRFDFNTLTLTNIQDSLEYDTNELDYIYSAIYARRNEKDKYYNRISDFEGYDIQTIKHYLPVEGIDDFLMWTDIWQSDLNFGSYKLNSEFKYDFTEPIIDLEITNNSIEKVELESSDGHFYKVSIQDTNSEYNIRWSLHGQIEGNNQIQIPNFDSYFSSIMTNYALENLKVNRITVYKTEQEWSYNQYILFTLETILGYNIPSSIEYYGVLQ